MSWLRNPGRKAGLIYLLLAFEAPFSLIVLPNMLYVKGDAARTAANVLSHEFLFRLGMFADVVSAVILILLTMALYDLFKGVSKWLAVMVVYFGGILPAALYFFGVATNAAALILFKGAPYLIVFTEPQRYALGMLFLRIHSQQIIVAETLWGVWLLPLAALVFKAEFFPRYARVILSVWLTLNGIAYLVQSFLGLVLPQYLALAETIAFPVQFGEVAFVLWLVIMGASPGVDSPGKARVAGA